MNLQALTDTLLQLGFKQNADTFSYKEDKSEIWVVYKDDYFQICAYISNQHIKILSKTKISETQLLHILCKNNLIKSTFPKLYVQCKLYKNLDMKIVRSKLVTIFTKAGFENKTPDSADLLATLDRNGYQLHFMFLINNYNIFVEHKGLSETILNTTAALPIDLLADILNNSETINSIFDNFHIDTIQ